MNNLFPDPASKWQPEVSKRQQDSIFSPHEFIGLEVSSVMAHQPTGIARYIQKLVPEIVQQIGPGQVALFYKLSRLKQKKLWWKTSGTRTAIYWRQFHFPPIRHLKLFHGLDSYVPPIGRLKKLITIHDLLVLKMPQDLIASSRFRERKQSMYATVLKYVDGIITPSQATRRDVVDILNFPAERIFVTPLGVDSRFFNVHPDQISRIRDKFRLTRPHFLFVGAISGRKNTARLVEAFARSRLKEDYQLLLAGSLSYRGEETLQAIQRLGLSSKEPEQSRVRILDYVPEADLPALYAGAVGFVFPTLYEGFGLPILEAMACGIPVLTANRGAAAEVAGEYAIQVDPESVEDIASGMEQLLTFSPDRLKAAKEYARTFTWKRCASGTIAVYREFLN